MNTPGEGIVAETLREMRVFFQEAWPLVEELFENFQRVAATARRLEAERDYYREALERATQQAAQAENPPILAQMCRHIYPQEGQHGSSRVRFARS